MRVNVYIAPANHDVSGFCNIYVKRCRHAIESARDDYRMSPSSWREVGRINSRGQVVCLESGQVGEGVYADIMESQPLMAGLHFAGEACASTAAPESTIIRRSLRPR